MFVRGAEGAWSQQARLTAEYPDGRDLFGNSLALSADGSILAVGAPGEASGADGVGGDPRDNSRGAAGAVYEFVRDAEGSWAQRAYLKASNSDALDGFGRSLAMSADGSTLAAGAPGEASTADGGGGEPNNRARNAGAVYVF